NAEAGVHVVHGVNGIEAAPLAHRGLGIVLAHAWFERQAEVAIVLEERRAPDSVWETSRRFCARVRVIPVAVFGIQELLDIRGVVRRMVHLAVRRIVFCKWRRCWGCGCCSTAPAA